MVTEFFRTFPIFAVVLASASALAGTPDWMRDATRTPLPNYPKNPDVVTLLDERVVSVSPDGEVRSTHRKAFKILRPTGRDKGRIYIYFDSQREITSLKAWGITATGEEFEVKKSDAITAGYSEELYSDTHYLVLQIPGAQPGNVVGYEFQQRERPSILQSIWAFQDENPVHHGRFVLELPPTWAYAASWRNHGVVPPQQSGANQWTWELTDIDPVQIETDMPIWSAVAGQLQVSFAPKDSTDKNNESWTQVGRWY